MDTLQGIISLMTPNCFMAFADLKDAYYSVPVALAHQKYLKSECTEKSSKIAKLWPQFKT